MLKVTTICLVLALASGALAIDGPVGKGSRILDGGISASGWGGDLYENSYGDAYLFVTVSPSSSVFVNDGLYLGGIADITFEKQGSAQLTKIAFGPTMGYFWGPEIERGESYKGHTLPYVRMFVLYQSWDFCSGCNAINGWIFGGGFGIVPMLSNSVGLNLGLTGRYDKIESVGGWIIEAGVGVTAFIWD